jgi:hypothetical protein
MATPVVKRRVVAKTASYSIEAHKDRSGTIFTNRGAAGAVTFTLPPPARCKGWEYSFVGVAAQNIVVAPTTADTLITLGSLDSDSISLATSGNIVGGRIEAVCDGTNWIASVSTNIPGGTTSANATVADSD